MALGKSINTRFTAVSLPVAHVKREEHWYVLV